MSYDIIYMWKLKYNTNEPIYEAETESGTYRTGLWLPREKGKREGWSRRLGLAYVNFFI